MKKVTENELPHGFASWYQVFRHLQRKGEVFIGESNEKRTLSFRVKKAGSGNGDEFVESELCRYDEDWLKARVADELLDRIPEERTLANCLNELLHLKAMTRHAIADDPFIELMQHLVSLSGIDFVLFGGGSEGLFGGLHHIKQGNKSGIPNWRKRFEGVNLGIMLSEGSLEAEKSWNEIFAETPSGGDTDGGGFMIDVEQVEETTDEGVVLRVCESCGNTDGKSFRHIGKNMEQELCICLDCEEYCYFTHDSKFDFELSKASEEGDLNGGYGGCLVCDSILAGHSMLCESCLGGKPETFVCGGCDEEHELKHLAYFTADADGCWIYECARCYLSNLEVTQAD